jgi:hypothetical protein
LGSEEILKSSFWEEQRFPQPICVSDCSSDVIVGEVLEGIKLVDGLDENLREDVLNAGASNDSLPRVGVPSFNELNEVSDIFGDKAENEDTLCFFVSDGLIWSVIFHFLFFGLKQVNKILPDHRQFSLNMLDQNHVKCLNKRPDTHPFMTVLVLFMLAEKLRLFIILFLQRKTTLQRPQVDTSVS